MQVLFIADVYADEVPGGGEIVNDLVINELINNGHHVIKFKSQDISTKDLAHYIANDFMVILGNHLALSQQHKNIIIAATVNPDSNFKYLIYEHDHKYLSSRDPSVYEGFLAPDDSHIVGRELYEQASAVL